MCNAFKWFSMINGFVQSVDRFADRVADRVATCDNLQFNGFVQSADRLADRFANRFDDLYGFAMFSNSFHEFQSVCRIC